MHNPRVSKEEKEAVREELDTVHRVMRQVLEDVSFGPSGGHWPAILLLRDYMLNRLRTTKEEEDMVAVLNNVVQATFWIGLLLGKEDFDPTKCSCQQENS